MVRKDSQQNSESRNSNSLEISKNKKLKKAEKEKLKTQEELEEELVHEHYGLVVSQALSFFYSSYFDDYIQAGLIGLLKAIRNYNSDKSKFSTFATVCIRNEMVTFDRKIKKKSFNNIVFDTENIEIFVRDKNKEPLPKDWLPNSLTEEDRFIIELKLQNYTNKEICSFLSCSKYVLSNKIKNISAKVKEHNK